MSKIKIVTDSHSSVSQEKAKELGILVLPMPFSFGDETFYEGTTLTREELFRRLDAGETCSTSQPSPVEVMNIWDEALKEADEVLYIPLSSGLSGSCMTAQGLAQDDKYEDKVFVVDNGRVSTPLHITILDAMELIEEGYSAAQIKQMLEAARDDMNIYIAVKTLENLKRGGRISATSAVVGSVLNIKPVLQLTTGSLNVFKKCHGMKLAQKTMIAAITEELNTTWKSELEAGNVHLLAASSAHEEDAAAWVEEIKDAFPGMDVLYDDISMGVSCHIGEGGLGIGYSIKPKRI